MAKVEPLKPAEIAQKLPGPHAWAWGIEEIFYCQACYVSFELGREPVPEGPCRPVYDPGPT